MAKRFAIALFVCGLLPIASLGASPSIGLPITRTYSIEEIGASRGPKLSFDHLGRLAVISGGSFIVLNDGTWIDLAVHQSDILPILVHSVNQDGETYFGALASWGLAQTTKDGLIRPISARPEKYPTWINSTNFTKIIFTQTGVLFAGTNGVVHLDSHSGKQLFKEIPVSTAFSLNSEIFLSSGYNGTVKLDPLTGETETIDPRVGVHETAAYGKNGLVAVTIGNKLVQFDGKRFTDLDLGFNSKRIGAISCLEALPEGGFAIAIDGEGLYLVNEAGEITMALTTTNYRRIYDLAVGDSGILWLSRESSVEKLLYNNPVSVVDHRSDVVIGWPQVIQNGDRNLIASNGLLYRMELSPDGWNYQFAEITNLPSSGVWAIASNRHHLLLGNSDGVFADNGESFEPVFTNFDANRLYFQEDDLCLVIGSQETAALKWDGEKWFECADRVKSAGFPSIAVRTNEALWIELGLDRVARVYYESGKLHYEILDQFPWTEPTWVNIGILNDYVVLSGGNNQRVYLDKVTAKPTSAPKIEEALSQSPETILRVSEAESGVVWATHPTGVLTFRPTKNGYAIDSESLASIRDQYPAITLINGQHTWISTESALYHVDQNFTPSQLHPRQPFLVSIVDGKTGEEIYSAAKRQSQPKSLPFSKNHLVFRYFSGGYTSQQDPAYDFSMQKGSDSWNIQSQDSLLNLPSLEEGNYQLTAQLTNGTKNYATPIVTSFIIEPPWFRSRLAYLLYWSAGALTCWGGIAIAFGRAKRKRDELETIVHQRTEELRETMQKLTDEARNSATLAERNRLAGEIHDSLQQGLSGLALQLDATLKHDDLDTNLRNRLSIARSMVSFTRQEVQQAVWDLESPLLQNENLSEALRNIGQLLGASSAKLKVQTSGTPADIPSRTKHHMLRIAQEAITNAIRHSDATQITVKLDYADTLVSLEVHDDGKGFDPHEVFAEGLGHFGLRGLRTRASKIDASIDIESKPNSGTSIRIAVPLSPEKTTTHPLQNER